MTTYSFKNDKGIWVCVKAIVDGTEPALYNDFDNTIHCSFFELGQIDEAHRTGKSYREIIGSMQKLSEVKI